MHYNRFFTHLFSAFVLTIAISMPGLAYQTNPFKLQAAKNYMAQSQWDYAAYEWNNILKENPNDLEALLGLVQSLIAAGLPEDALVELNRSQTNLMEPQVKIWGAIAHHKAGHIETAKHTLLSLLDEDPFEAAAVAELKKVSAQLSREEQTTVIKKLEEIAALAMQKAEDAVNAQDYKEAARYYKVILAYRPSSQAANNYALALLLSGNKEAALKRLKKIPADTLWQTQANTALYQVSVGQSAKAIATLKKAIANCTDTLNRAKLYNNLGYLYELTNHSNEARYAYEHALELDPNLTKAQANLAFILLKQKHYQPARALYQRMIENERNNALAWSQLGFTYELEGNFKQALKHYRRAIELKPNLKEAYLNLTSLYKKMGKTELADETYKQWMSLEFKRIEQPASPTMPATAFTKLLNYADVFYADIH